MLTTLASKFADEIYSKCPVVKSELLNRDQPSGNANAALYALLRSLLKNIGKMRIGIEGYPQKVDYLIFC